METKAGYATTTYRLKLHSNRLDWVAGTKALYNRVIGFYHGLLTERMELLELGNMELLRQLERLTVVGRDKTPVEAELPFRKVPVYFRRAAINAAIGYARSYRGLLRNWEAKKEEAEALGKEWKKKPPTVPKEFHASPLLYRGMYKEFEEGSILIKLWNGSSWVWVKHMYSGREISSEARLLSPTLVLRKKSLHLHVPVEEPVADTRTVRERVRDGERYCAVSFTASDVLATCVLFGSDGHGIDSYFIRGGKEFSYRRKRLLNQIYKNRSLTGALEKGENGHRWKRVRDLNTYCAHLVSRRILDYCKRQGVKLLVLPQISGTGWKPFQKGNGKFTFLGAKIAQFVDYKAWMDGIVVTTVRPQYTTIKCNHCGEYMKRYNEGHQAATNYYGGRLFRCPSGHRGNTALNAARNIGTNFYKKFCFVKEDRGWSEPDAGQVYQF